MTAAKKPKVLMTKGKKKTAVARVTIKDGKGTIKVNGKLIQDYNPAYSQQIILEPVLIAAEVLGAPFVESININANVNGGGFMSQAHAARTGIGKALVEWTGNEDLKKAYVAYDRSIVVDDARKKESKKFLRKGARAKPIKAYR